MLLATFIEELRRSGRFSREEIDSIKAAGEFAESAHIHQKRRSGEPYFNHCLATAHALYEWGLDAETIAAGFLHDVLEDVAVDEKTIEDRFGGDVLFMVKGVTKLGKLRYRGHVEYAENLRRMILAMGEDIRVILVKLADRLHNIRTLKSLPPDKQKKIAAETLEIYAPIALRLGMGYLKGELEDLCFPFVYPKEHEALVKQVALKYKERTHYLEKIKPLIQRELAKEGITNVMIDARAKHYYSLWRKLKENNKNVDAVYDLIALRIIVDTMPECYATLGIIHKLWRPLPGRIKDYIALPKSNGYQSLHTTVFCEDGVITEFQIRTRVMHDEAERGVAAHWAYAESGKPAEGVKANSAKLAWITTLREWQDSVQEEDFLKSLKIDYFKDRIFVFTPKGDVVNLPTGSTPIDFAYDIHSDIGNHCMGTKVNGKMVQLHKKLQNGDVVEIITQKNKKPVASWLDFVRTSYAKGRIRQALGMVTPPRKSKVKNQKSKLQGKI